MKKLLVLLALLVGVVDVRAQQAFPLIVNGSTELQMHYDKGVLAVRFRHTRRGAISPEHFAANVPPGSGAWLDRPVNAQEPVELRQTMTPAQATEAMARLKQNGGFWKFFCFNTGKGFFGVTRSERAAASQRID